MGLFDILCRSREFRQKLEHSRARLYRMAYAWTRQPALAEDLVQDTLAKALKSAGQLREIQAMDAWLFSILANCWRDYLRRYRDMVDIDEVAVYSESTPEQEHGEKELVEMVRAAVMRLPTGQRQVLSLVDLEGFSYVEVAGILDIPIGTVMSRLCRARAALKTLLLAKLPRDPAVPQSPMLRRIK